MVTVENRPSPLVRQERAMEKDPREVLEPILDDCYAALVHLARQGECLADAEDAVQDAFLAAVEFLNKLKPDAPRIKLPRPWLFAILRHTLSKRSKQQARLGQFQSLDATEEPLARSPEHRAETIEYVKQLFAKLSRKQKVCCILRFLGFDDDEIANKTGMNKNTIRSHIRRAKAKVEDEISHDEGG